MTAIDGSLDKVGNDPVETGSLLSLLPSIALHALVFALIWLGIANRPEIQPPVTFISLAPAAAPTPEEPAPPAPSVPAPDLEPEFEPLPLPATGMVLPQPEPPQPETVVDFTPPEAPELESFPFDPKATRPAEPEPEDAVPLEKAEEKPKPKAPEKPKPRPDKKKPAKPKKETQQAAAPAKAESKPVQTPAPAAVSPSQPAKTQTAPAKPAAPKATQNAAISDEPVRITNPTLAGNCPAKYPERARRRNQEGTVVLRFTIGTDGKPYDISVVQSSGHSLLDEAAQEIIAGCNFVPQMRGNRAVRAIADQPMPFRLN